MKTPFVGWMMMPLTGFVIFAEGIGAENVAELINGATTAPPKMPVTDVATFRRKVRRSMEQP